MTSYSRLLRQDTSRQQINLYFTDTGSVGEHGLGYVDLSIVHYLSPV